jgi:cation diffusion facilitator family transporter
MSSPSNRGIHAAQLGLLVNAALVVIKLVAGVLGNAYALIADAVESSADLFSSLIVWSGLRIASREADEEYPFGYGKAEPLAAAVVALMLIGAALGIAVEAIREIRTPHHTPAPFTLIVLVLVIGTKEILFRRVVAVGDALGSTAVKTDAWHHRSDAITSLAAFIGISIAVIGGPGWEAADDWAALAAAGVILVNASLLIRPAIHDLMDRSPGADLVSRISAVATSTPGVRHIEKLKVRKAGLAYYVDLHVQADPAMSLRDAHNLSGRVKSAIRAEVSDVAGVLIHMEPHEL